MSDYSAKELSQEVLRQKNILVQTLLSNDVSASESESFNTLIPKIGQISKSTDIVYGERTLLSSEGAFEISGLPFTPTQIAITCEKALLNELNSVTEYVYVAILSLDIGSSDLISGQVTSASGLQFACAIDPTAIATVQETNGTYIISLSFNGLNAAQNVPFAFAPFYTYTWAIS